MNLMQVLLEFDFHSSLKQKISFEVSQINCFVNCIKNERQDLLDGGSCHKEAVSYQQGREGIFFEKDNSIGC